MKTKRFYSILFFLAALVLLISLLLFLPDRKVEKFSFREYNRLIYNPRYSKPKGDLYQIAKNLAAAYFITDSTEIKIFFSKDEIYVNETDLNLPFGVTKYFDRKSRRLKEKGNRFSLVRIGVWKIYNSKGEVIKERDEDENYPFSLSDLVIKMKSEYGVDIMDKENISVSRFFYDKFDTYVCHIYSMNPQKRVDYVNYYIDGTNGELLFKKSGHVEG